MDFGFGGQFGIHRMNANLTNATYNKHKKFMRTRNGHQISFVGFSLEANLMSFLSISFCFLLVLCTACVLPGKADNFHHIYPILRIDWSRPHSLTGVTRPWTRVRTRKCLIPMGFSVTMNDKKKKTNEVVRTNIPINIWRLCVVCAEHHIECHTRRIT